MKQAGAIVLCVLTAFLSVTGTGSAQPRSSVQVYGTIRATDCRAHTVTIDIGAGSGSYRTAATAAVVVDATAVQFCALQQYAGASVLAWLTAINDELVVTRIEVSTQGSPPPSTPAPAYPAPNPYATPYYPPAYYPAPYYPPAYYAPPLAGVVLGTVLVAGLVYLLVRHPGGALYRYPYYGPYYRFYYRPYYRPYYGPLLGAPAYVYGGYRRCPGLSGWGQWCR